jgi:hypothetical protein
MPVKIGTGLKKQLPLDEREGLEEYLWSKSNDKCHLCEAPMNAASDNIEADHDMPEASGGVTSRDNLWLAHSSCNRAKKDNPSVNVRPYLKLKAHVTGKGHLVRYDGVLDLFKINPKASKVVFDKDLAKFQFPDSSVSETPVFIDSNAHGRDFRYVYVRVPQEALFNDDEVQPRSLKIAQVWAIYNDLQTNPLHEPPSCRLIPAPNGMSYLALFDGQHKTVASWMTGEKFVTAKVYLDMTKDEANYLVNSIQARIKKLPLSPFELSAKLSDEWQVRLDDYRSQVAPGAASEEGFIDFLDSSDKSRAKSAFEAALVRGLITSPELTLTKYVALAGQPKTADSLITETQFSSRVLKPLLHTKPLGEPGELGEELRNRERENIIRALNQLQELVFEPSTGANELTDAQLERRRRFIYGTALEYIANLVKSAYRQLLAVEPERSFLEKTPTEAQETEIRAALERLVEHPIWMVDLKKSPKTRAVEDALSKNQDTEKAFGAVGLKVGYLVGADKLPNDWYE